MSFVSFVTTIIRALNEAEVPFMLTGSFAAAFYGTPRATQDIDLVIEAQSENLDAVGLTRLVFKRRIMSNTSLSRA